MIVDAHCHASPVWFEPVETLVFQMDRLGVAHGVLVQALGQYDNAYQQSCLARFPGRFVSVVGVDPGAPLALEALARLAEQGARGVRLRPLAESPGDDPLAIWRLAASLGLAVSCVGATAQFRSPALAERLSALPDLTVVLEHLGGLARPDAEADALAPIMALARFPNVYLKLPGLGQLAPRSPSLPPSGSPLKGEAATPALTAAITAFGPHRLMWGSDFPPVASREGYANALDWMREAIAPWLDGEGVAAVFGRTAAKAFGVPDNG